MNTENVTAVIRPRSGWEAADLGVAFARRHFLSVLRFWALAAIPLWGAAVLAFHDQPAYVILVVWWSKPACERMVLLFLSRSLFGETLRLRGVLRGLPGFYFRAVLSILVLIGPMVLLDLAEMPPGGAFTLKLLWLLVAMLVARRFAFKRSFHMPVALLEGTKGKVFRQRTDILDRQGGSVASKFTFACGLLELGLTLALVTAVAMVIPEMMRPWELLWNMFLELVGFTGVRVDDSVLWAFGSIYAIAITLVLIFYAGGGFGLYLNARTHLEGWDIELAFRQLGTRMRDVVGPATGAIAAGFFVWLAGTGEIAAQEADEFDPSEVISEVKAHPDFKIHRVERPVYKSESEPIGDGKYSSGGLAFLQPIGELLFWGVVIGGIAFVIYIIWKNRDALAGLGGGGGDGPPPPARTVLGMNVRSESLPKDIVAAARALWAEGRHQEAVRVLYRGSLSWLVEKAALPIRESDTESDCVRSATGLQSFVQQSYFTKLTDTWVACAYGGMAPSNDGAETLFREWPFMAGAQKGAEA